MTTLADLEQRFTAMAQELAATQKELAALKVGGAKEAWHPQVFVPTKNDEAFTVLTFSCCCLSSSAGFQPQSSHSSVS